MSDEDDAITIPHQERSTDENQGLPPTTLTPERRAKREGLRHFGG